MTEGVIVMIAAYNLYLGGYLPKVSPKNSVHNKSELKSKYKSIVSLNNANPLVMVKLYKIPVIYEVMICNEYVQTLLRNVFTTPLSNCILEKK